MAVSKQTREIRKLLDELSEKLGELGEDASSELMEGSEEWLSDLKDKAVHGWQAARQRSQAALDLAKERGRQADKYAHENPWQVIAGAAAIGAMIGYLMASKRS